MIIKYEMKSPDGCSNENLRCTKVKAITSILYSLTNREDYFYNYRSLINLVEIKIGKAEYHLELNYLYLRDQHRLYGDELTLTIIKETNSTRWLIKEIKRLLRHINRFDSYDQITLNVIH